MVLPIVGMGGFGKTTLAQLVYNDSRICEFFKKRCWVFVSEDFDLVRLTKAIVESMSNNPCQFFELSMLQGVLKENIRGHELFLVLDDVWNEKRNLWECFRVDFFGAKFVRILTTTRNTLVANIMQTTSPFQLSSLLEENCWSLFKHFSFGNRETSENANLHEIGRGIVKKCKGSPLAIKTLGGILRYEMDEEIWREILESDISEIDETREVMPALRLSYQKLPQHLKPCFLYLSMFPKGTRFGKNQVVRLWMAQGYINGNTRNLKTLEEIGSEYFDELQGRSLVGCGPSTRYFLHDLIHDLASSIISQEAYEPVLENDQQCNGPCKVYHLFQNNSLFSNTFGTLKHLRYLWIKDSQMETLPETLCLLYNLQTLYLCCVLLRELPVNIKNLINLRYFKLTSDKIQQVPKSIFLLRSLHTLSLRYCTKLKELPMGIEQLTRLHILDFPSSLIYMPRSKEMLTRLHVQDFPSSLIYMPCGIGKLTNLKPLKGHFSVMDQGIIGGLGELKNMNKLSGLLCLTGLRNISDVEHSRNANLASKPNLCKLTLNFQEDHSMLNCRDKLHLHLNVSSTKNAKNENDEKMQDVVLQSLQPHGNLTKLEILKYEGRIFPSWLLNPALPKLTTLTVNFCTEPDFLPPFGQLPNLRFLKISRSFDVGFVGDELRTNSLLTEYGSTKQPNKPSYPSLEVLSLKNTLNLVEWQAHDGDFPCLKKLSIVGCLKLRKITKIPQKVREVTFKHCPKLKLLTCPSVVETLTIHECGFSEIMLGSISKSLIISNCIELISINWMDGGLNAVREVSFNYCPKLELKVPMKNVLHSVTQRAEIHGCPRLYLGKRYVYQRDTTAKVLNLFENDEIHLSHASVNSTIPLLEKSFTLYFTKEDFREVESLTWTQLVGVSCQCTMLNLTSLAILDISKCTKVISVAGLDNLSNLKRLSISYCPELCNWNDKTLPLSLMSIRLCSCDKLSSFPLLWVQNHSNILKVLVIKRCPRLAVLEGFHSLTKLEIVNVLYCRKISISPATESLQFRPHFTIVDCPLMRYWCQKNNVTYYQLNPIDYPQDDMEAEQESAGAITKD